MDSDLALAGSDQNLNGKQRSCQCFSLVKRRALYLSTVRNHYQRSEAELKSLPWLSVELKCELVTREFVSFVHNVCSSWVSSLMWPLLFSASGRISSNRCGFLQPQLGRFGVFVCLLHMYLFESLMLFHPTGAAFCNLNWGEELVYLFVCSKCLNLVCISLYKFCFLQDSMKNKYFPLRISG